MKKTAALLMAAALCFSAAACARAPRAAQENELPLIPLPNGKAEVGGGRVALPDALGADPGDFPIEFLDVYAERAGVTLSSQGPAFLRVAHDANLLAEEYRLRVSEEEGIQIVAADERGLCWALATLAALTEGGEVPVCYIEDAPHYAYRGFMMDSARYFYPVEVIKTLIELTSMVKYNTFHWHLTDDQGWRIESELFPALHEQFPGEYYTQDEIREIVEFARLRGMEVIPEVDVPGHVTALLAAYPSLSCRELPVKAEPIPGIRSTILCAGKERVFELLFPLLEEVAGLFPSPYVHLGGDEAPKDEWNACPHCARRLEAEGLADTEELQGWFIARLAKHLEGLDKRVICWNESLLSGYLWEHVPNLTIQYWAEARVIGPPRDFWARGGDMIFSGEFGAYLDLPHGAVTLKKAYNYAPATIGFQGKGLPALGIEACMWTDYTAETEELARLAFPRAYALAEAAWTRPEFKNYKNFRGRLDPWLARTPGLGFTPPSEADPGWLSRIRENAAFLVKLSKDFDDSKENNAGTAGKLHWRYTLGYAKEFFLW